MKITLLALLSMFITLCIQAQGQTRNPATTEEETTPDGLWDGRFKGGSYLVKCDRISALSKHEYVADGVARVVEVNLTMNSNMAVRFYYLEPLRLEGGGIVGAGQGVVDKTREVVQGAATRISPTLTEIKVVKSYPHSTHAHTVEFVLGTEEQLIALHASLERSFRTGRGRIWRE